MANVVEKENENSNGEGSGEVNFIISASNVTSYKVLINSETLTFTQNEFTYTFTAPGTKDYTVIVSAYNGLNFVSNTISVTTIDNRRVSVSEYSNHYNEWHPFEHKMYVILSAGVGGQQYTYGGAIVPEAQFPCSVYIDWVRVYTFE